MSQLRYTELGNTAGAMTNTGDFLNLQSYGAWCGTALAPKSSLARRFDTSDSYQVVHKTSDGLPAMAVRCGDVAAVPEPQAYALLLLGTSAGALVMRWLPR